jgi:hypothetical protein
MGTPPQTTNLPKQPTEAELSALFSELAAAPSNRFSAATINNAVSKLVKSGKIRANTAGAVRAYAVFAEDLIRGQLPSVSPRRAARGLEERYFLGGQSEAETSAERELLRTARTSSRADAPTRRGREDLGVPEKTEQLIRRALQSPGGKKLAESITSRQVKTGTRPPLVRKEVDPETGAIRKVRANPLARLRPSAKPAPKEEPSKPIKGSTLAEKRLSAKRTGSQVGRRATTKSGKPIRFRFPDSGKPISYKEETLKSVLGPEGSDVLAGIAPLSKTSWAKLNAAAAKGDPIAALLLQKERMSRYKTGERARKAQQTVTGPVTKPKAGGGFEPVINRATGKPVMRTETPAEQARRRARNESKYGLGMTAREEAKRAEMREPGGRTRARQVKTVPEAIRERAEREIRGRISKGEAGPLQREAAEYVSRKGREALESADPELIEDLKRLSRIRTVKPEPSPEVVLERRRQRDEPSITPREQRAVDRARGRKTRFGALERIDRLSRIMRARGKGR